MIVRMVMVMMLVMVVVKMMRKIMIVKELPSPCYNCLKGEGPFHIEDRLDGHSHFDPPYRYAKR